MINETLDRILPYKLALIGSITRNESGNPVCEAPNIFKQFRSEENLLKYVDKFQEINPIFLRKGEVKEKIYFYQVIPPVENEWVDVPECFKSCFKEYSKN